jgi:hypothetical protein
VCYGLRVLRVEGVTVWGCYGLRVLRFEGVRVVGL